MQLARTIVIAFGISFCSLLMNGCGNNPPPTFPPPKPPQSAGFDVVLCSAPVIDQNCPRVQGHVTVNIGPNTFIEQDTDASGYTLLVVPSSIVYTYLDISATGYINLHIDGFQPGACTNGCHNFEVLLPLPVSQPAHVDPSGITLETLARIRGAMWPTGELCNPPLALPFGPRPGQPTNIIATDFFADYTHDQQQSIIACLKQVGYTHVVVGPLVDSDGYHGQYTPHDWRQSFDNFLDILQSFWDGGLAPVVFIHPDGWTFDQTQALATLLTSERAQRLIRIVVPTGWEPTRYGWSSCTWAQYLQWTRQILPNALVLIHTVSDTDAPAGADALCDDNRNPNGNAGAWIRVVPYLHGWLIQNGPYNIAPSANVQLARNFATQFIAGKVGKDAHSIAWHFAGNAGWPTYSAWGNQRIKLYNAESTAYEVYWHNLPVATARAWGDLAIQSGADGVLDGATIPLP